MLIAIDATEMRSCHHAAFRSGEWARILRIEYDEAAKRQVYLLMWPNERLAFSGRPVASRDTWPVDDPGAEYEFRVSP